MFAQQRNQAIVDKLAPAREVGIVFGTLFGLFILKERQGICRMSASAAVAAGIVLVATSAH